MEDFQYNLTITNVYSLSVPHPLSILRHILECCACTVCVCVDRPLGHLRHRLTIYTECSIVLTGCVHVVVVGPPLLLH